MKFLVIDPITSNSNVCSFSVFSEQFSFLYQHILKISDSEQYFNDKYKYICFDAFKTLDMFDLKFSYLRDIKVLYELKGVKFSNLIFLGRKMFGYDYMTKYIEISDKINAHLNSYRITKIDHNRYGEDELFPFDLLQDLYRERAQVIVDLMKEYKRDEDLDITMFYKNTMYKNIKALYTIGKVPINSDLAAIEYNNSHYVRAIKKNIVDGKIKLQFSAVGAKTGRLSFKKGGINLYSLPKDIRKCIVPAKDCTIAQFDFKSLHPRLAIFSTNNTDFKNKFVDIEDIYSLFPGDRDKNKISFLAWMYSSVKNKTFEEVAFPIQELRTRLHIEARKNGKIINYFGRVLQFEDEERKIIFQNFITSLEVDVILYLTRWINKALTNRKSRIIFPFHDAIVFEIHKDELELMKHIKNYMESSHKNMFGSILPVDVKVGPNFGELKKVEL